MFLKLSSNIVRKLSRNIAIYCLVESEFKVAIATLNFMNEFYNGGFAPDISVSMLKQTIALVREYVSKTRK